MRSEVQLKLFEDGSWSRAGLTAVRGPMEVEMEG
jgi:hypothetical protein